MRHGARCTAALVLAFALPAGPGPAGAKDRPGRPEFVDLRPKQERLFLKRVGRAPRPFREAIAASYERLRVKRARSRVGGGDYTLTTIDSEGTRYTVALSPRSLRPGAWGNHMTAHELGHVIINSLFDARAYSVAAELFGLSDEWLDCFPLADTVDECVPMDEIIADELAFYATGFTAIRSSYDIPVLAPRGAVGDLLPRLIGG